MFSRKTKPKRHSQSYRPRMETLEGRLAMASIVPFTDFDGNLGVKVVDGAASSELEILDNAATDIVKLTLKAKNKPDIVVQGAFRVFDIEMGNGNDKVTYDVQGDHLTNDNRQFNINLGGGRNTLLVDGGTLFQGSNIGFDITGGKSNDFLDISFDRIDASSLTILGNLGAGADGELDAKNKVIGPSRVLVGDNDLIMDSNVTIDFDLGTGRNEFFVGVNANLGHVANLPASQVEVSIQGSDRKADVDKITLDLTDCEVAQGALLAVDVDLLAGNDFFTALLPGSFGMLNFDSAAGSQAILDINGGKGNDTILITRNGAGANEIELDGLLTLLLSGGEGNDNLKVDFGAFGLLKTNNDNAQDRGLRLRMNGDAGNDTLETFVSNNSTATFLYDLQMKGGAGNDNITIGAANVGGNPSFGTKIGQAGEILIDGGQGTDLRRNLAIGGLPVLSLGFEGELQ